MVVLMKTQYTPEDLLKKSTTANDHSSTTASSANVDPINDVTNQSTNSFNLKQQQQHILATTTLCNFEEDDNDEDEEIEDEEYEEDSTINNNDEEDEDDHDDADEDYVDMCQNINPSSSRGKNSNFIANFTRFLFYVLIFLNNLQPFLIHIFCILKGKKKF